MQDDILKKVIAVLSTDNALQTILGGIPTNPRVYLYYQADAYITPELAGYITVAMTNSPAARGAVAAPVYTIALWGRGQAIIENCTQRVRAVLHKQVISTAMSRQLYTKIVNASDRFQPAPNFSGRTMQITAEWLEI